ncbi:hybrid sensor histidine kinase/response regulator [Humisphaera borealis]|uniref:histidine kinase n=1 Tax=Humisphaera borealis TaxID=2807512 RepID=A0A7M2WZT4_9BACT|nr:response regulator [Humisphaera borealis]QOV90712.1 response regulator [Humisphaera borealis]
MDRDDVKLQRDGRILILHLEDSPLDADLTVARLRREGLEAEVRRVDTRAAFESAIESGAPWDAILSDYKLPAFDGMSALSIARQNRPDVPFIFVSGVLGEENAIDSLKLGATDYVLKQRMDRLVPSLRRALAEAAERRRRRDVEQELSRSQAQLRFTLEAVRIGHWDVDAASGRFRARSPFFDHIFGCDRPDLPWDIDRLLSHVHADDAPNAGSSLNSVLRPGGHCEFECRILWEDGTERWVWIKGAHHPSTGSLESGSASGLVMDITARKLAEQERERLLRSEREARSEAERASRLKDDFLATLSHELRTPLNAVLGWAQLLRRGAVPAHEQPATMEIIERNARLQAQLVEDLLDMSRITSGKLRLESEPTELTPVIRAALSAIQPAAESRSVKLVDHVPRPSLVVRGDASRLQQVFWNLLSNAVKFTPPGGEVEVSATATRDWVEVKVKDTGQGIDLDFLPNVFDRFRQQDSSIVRRHGGLGVGLSIVRHLVELHGGEVYAESDGPGTGATFIVRLPRSRINPNGSITFAGRMKPPSLTGLKVLVVDDEPDARDYFRRILVDCGAQVLVADRAETGMKILESERPDLLLSDIGMPEQDGYTFIRRVRASGDGMADIPAIALTAYARPEDRQRSLSAGFNDHLSKPVDVARLLERVSELMSA